jgi:hypothetical protein
MPDAFLQIYKFLIIPLHPPNCYMLELSPASTKCTHGATVKLFYRCSCLGGCEVMLYSPLHSRPWNGWIQRCYKITPIRFWASSWRVKPRGRNSKIEYTPFTIYFCNYNDLDRIPLTTQVYGHDVEHYALWFVTWGVLCHSTVTKILKGRCGWHTLLRCLVNHGDDPSHTWSIDGRWTTEDSRRLSPTWSTTDLEDRVHPWVAKSLSTMLILMITTLAQELQGLKHSKELRSLWTI